MALPAWTRANWLREPLVHFVALGAVVYLALTWGGQPIDPSSRVIEVGAEEQARLATNFENVMGRAPTDAELDARIEQFVRDEVLYREAIRLGLDQGDAVVRQRMVAKMDMSASAAAEAAQPNDAVLRAYYEANHERYSGEVLVTFSQVYFRAKAAAEDALDRGAFESEPISLPSSVEDAKLRDVQGRFGDAFARGLAELQASDDWQGPIQSGFGWHLVKLSERRAEVLEFEALRERLENDWRSEEIAARKTRAFDLLRSAYRVEIDR